MNPITNDHTPTLESVQEQFQAWRAGKTGREPIPEHLWGAAVQLCRDYPLTQVSRTLRLSFNDLKKRIHIIYKAPPVAFTELEIQPIIRPWEIECRRRDGSQLRISSTGPLTDLNRLVRDFLA